MIGLWLCALWSISSAFADDGRQLSRRYVVEHYTAEQGLPQNSVNAIARYDGYLWFGTFGGLARYDGVRFTAFHRSDGLDRAPGSDRILDLLRDSRNQFWVATEGAGLYRYDKGVFTASSVCDARCSVFQVRELSPGRLLIASSVGVFTLDTATDSAVRVSAFGTNAYRVAYVFSANEYYVAGHYALFQMKDGVFRVVHQWPRGGIVVGLGRDRDRLWVGTGIGLYYLDRTRGVLSEPSGPDWVRQLIRVDAHQHGVFYGSYRQGLIYQDESSGRLDSSLWPGAGELRAILRDDDGNLWVGTDGDGLYRLHLSELSLLGGPGTDMPEPVSSIVNGPDGSMWIGRTCNGLTRVDASGHADPQPPGFEHFSGECVGGMFAQPDGSLWAGTFGGVLIHRGVDGTVDADPDWPKGTSVRALQMDGAGRLLIGSDHGLFVKQGHEVHHVDALGGAEISMIVPARAGGFWVSSNRGLFRVKDDQVVERWSPQNGLSGRFVRSVYEDERGVLWVGTYGDGLDRIENGKVSVFRSTRGLGEDVVSCMLRDDDNRLWMSGNRGIEYVPMNWLDRAAQDGGDVESVTFYRSTGLRILETNGGSQPSCVKDSRGRLWFSLVSGVAVVDPAQMPPRRDPPPIRIESVKLDGVEQHEGQLKLAPQARNLEIQFTALNFAAPERTRFRFRLAGHDDEWSEVGTRREAYYPVLPYGNFVFEVEARSETGVWSTEPARLPIDHLPPWYLRFWMGPLYLLAAVAFFLLLARLRARHLENRTAELEALVNERTLALEKLNLQLRQQATSDPLTGVSNRAGLTEALESLWSVACEMRAPMSVLMIDVDQFKVYNDLYGHVAGDEALFRVAGAIASVLRPQDRLARYGGEEFVVLLPNTAQIEACRVGETLRLATLDAQIPHEGSPLQVLSLSVGCATLIASEAVSAFRLVEHADEALYRAKRSGRNRVEV